LAGRRETRLEVIRAVGVASLGLDGEIYLLIAGRREKAMGLAAGGPTDAEMRTTGM
jgi:hypothetical protein